MHDNDNVLFVCTASSAHAQLFQCQPSEDDAYGQVFPNIPDMYFNPAQAANSLTGTIPALTALGANMAYVFIIPAVGSNRNCSGDVVAFEYCYRTSRTIGSGQRTVFEFLRLTRNPPVSSTQLQTFTVDSRFSVRDNPSTATCTDIAGTTDQVCCSVSDLNRANQHEALTIAYIIGIAVSNGAILSLAISNSQPAFNFNRYETPLSTVQEGGSFTQSPLPGRSIALLRFYLGMYIRKCSYHNMY